MQVSVTLNQAEITEILAAHIKSNFPIDNLGEATIDVANKRSEDGLTAVVTFGGQDKKEEAPAPAPAKAETRSQRLSRELAAEGKLGLQESKPEPEAEVAPAVVEEASIEEEQPPFPTEESPAQREVQEAAKPARPVFGNLRRNPN